jgi:hypothetical protein
VDLLDDGVERHLGIYQYQGSIDLLSLFWSDLPRKLCKRRFSQ